MLQKKKDPYAFDLFINMIKDKKIVIKYDDLVNLVCDLSHSDLIKFKINLDFDFNSIKSNTGQTIIFNDLILSSPNLLKIIDFVDLKNINKNGDTVLSHVLKYNKNNVINVVNKLLDNDGIVNGFKDKHRNNELLLSLQNKFLDEETIIRIIDTVKINLHDVNERCQNALILASLHKREKVLCKLFETPNINYNKVDTYDNNALYYLITENVDENIILNVIDKFIIFNKQYSENFKNSCINNMQNICLYLLKDGIKIDDGNLFLLACKYNMLHVANRLIELNYKNFHAKNEHNCLYYACKNGWDDIAVRLFENNVDINLDKYYECKKFITIDSKTSLNSPLHFAIINKMDKISKIIAEKTTYDYSIHDISSGLFPLSVSHNNENLALYFLYKLSQKVDLSTHFNSISMTSIIMDSFNNVMNNLILKLMTLKINFTNEYNFTYLIAACYCGSSELATNILENYNPDVNAYSKYNETALLFACNNKWENIAIKLIDMMDIDVINMWTIPSENNKISLFSGRTNVWCLANEMKLLNVVEALIDKGI